MVFHARLVLVMKAKFCSSLVALPESLLCARLDAMAQTNAIVSTNTVVKYLRGRAAPMLV